MANEILTNSVNWPNHTPPKTNEVSTQARVEAKNSPEHKETISVAQKRLDELKKSIENGSFNIELTLDILKEIKNISPEQKPVVIWMILAGINNCWIWLALVSWNKIILQDAHWSKDPSLKNSFENALNDSLKKWDFSMWDFYNWLAYRTSLMNQESWASEQEMQKKDNKSYFFLLCKKYNINFWNWKENSDAQELKDLSPEKYNTIKALLLQNVRENQADREFLIAYLDDLYSNNWKNLQWNFLKEYKKNNERNKLAFFEEIWKLDDATKAKLNIQNDNDLTQRFEFAKQNPSEFIRKNSNNESVMVMTVIFGLIWLFAWWWKWMLAWWALWFAWTSLAWDISMDSLSGLVSWKIWEQKMKNHYDTEQKPNEEAVKEYAKIDFWEEKYNYLYWNLLKNNKFLNLNNSFLNIFDDQKDEAIIIQEFKKLWIENIWDKAIRLEYKELFARLKKQREEIIWKPAKNESIDAYLKRSSRITQQEQNTLQQAAPVLSANAATNATAKESSSQTTSNETISTNENFANITKEELQNSFNSFKLNIQDFEKSETFLWWLSKEKKAENKEKLYKEYINLKQKLISFELKQNLNEEDRNFINNIKLYLANYFADKLGWDEENDFNKNYELSSNLALEMLPQKAWNIEKPTLNLLDPNEVNLEVAKTIKGQKWTFLYDSKELTDYIVWEVQKWRKIEEILLDEQVNDTIVEIKWGIVEKYESDLEKYLDNLNDDNLTEDQVKAKELVYDIHWFGYTNIKEINWDITKQAWWTLAAIWAWIWAWFGAWAIAWIWTWPWVIATSIVWAIAWGITTTAWIMINQWDDYSEDWWDWAKELAINTATFWVWWLVFKWARWVQWWSKLLSMRWLWALGAEMVWDISIWAWNDLARYDVSIGEAFANNIYWCLLPLWIAWAWKIKWAFSKKRQELAEYILTQAKWADFLIALWKHDEAKSLLRKLAEKITRIRSYSEDTQNLLKPLENNLDEIRALKEWESLTLKNWEKVTLKNWNYVFYWRFDSFINENKWKFWCEYFNNNEKLLIDIDSSGNVTKIVKENGIEITLQADIKRYIWQKMDEVIPKQVIDEAIKWFYIKSQISSEIRKKLAKTWDNFDIWWTVINKVDKWYQVAWSDVIYKNLDDVLNNPTIIKPENFVKYWQQTIDVQLKARTANLNFESNWTKYSIINEDWKTNLYKYDKNWKNWEKIDEINSWEAKKIMDENYEQLFKLTKVDNIVEKSAKVFFDYKNMKLIDFVKKHWSKFWDWMSIKNHWTLFNMTIWEILTFPKIASQILKSWHWVFTEKWKRLSHAWDMLKALAYGDKDRTLAEWVIRATTVWALVSYDWIYGDSNDNDFIDALQYQYWWILAELLYTLLSENE